MSSVRQQINISAGPRAVWRAFTSADGIASWLVDSARIEEKSGGRVVLDTEDDDGNAIQERGLFHVFRPTRAMEIAFDRKPDTPWAGSLIKIAIARDGDETRVVLVHSGNTESFTDDDRRAQLDKEWRGALRSLRGALEG
ncbi:MAG: hypothetical protein ACI8PZ_002762 [Myxococcota bacterium]|jgi:uncharacterized protein YndB with AHSA1/START domain